MSNTLTYYNENAQEYFNNTVKGNMQLSYDKFLKYIPKNSYILDFGCGSGRDSKYFLDQGYRIKAIDGSIELCLIAEKYLNHKVENMYFSELNDNNVYDGIWSCASILHINKKEFIGILKKMVTALKKEGIMYISFKNGIGEEIINGRYFQYYTKEEFINVINSFDDLEILDIYITKSTTNFNEEKEWNNFILKKIR